MFRQTVSSILLRRQNQHCRRCYGALTSSTATTKRGCSSFLLLGERQERHSKQQHQQYQQTTTTRTHMNHGNPDLYHSNNNSNGSSLRAASESSGGPRESMALGYETTKHVGMVLRLLESSHGHIYNGTVSLDTLMTVWHDQGQVWIQQADGEWKWQTPPDVYHTPPAAASLNGKRQSQQHTTPRLLSLTFSDERTVMAQIIGTDGRRRFVSLLRLDSNSDDDNDGRSGGTMMTSTMNDGWTILREVIAEGNDDKNIKKDKNMQDIHHLLETYLEIEHGGGPKSREQAQTIVFHPDAMLLSVGMDPPTATPSDTPSLWSAPVGSLLTISLDTYLEGVATQTPHDAAASRCDEIQSVTVVGDSMAMATVRVGNGAQTLVFEDHLLLGKDVANSGGEWKILSKIFSPQPSRGPKNHSRNKQQ